jgi:WD40 repeat protein
VHVRLKFSQISIRGHTDPINALDAVESVVFSGCRAGVVRVWSAATSDCLRIYSGHTGTSFLLLFTFVLLNIVSQEL